MCTVTKMGDNIIGKMIRDEQRQNRRIRILEALATLAKIHGRGRAMYVGFGTHVSTCRVFSHISRTFLLALFLSFGVSVEVS